MIEDSVLNCNKDRYNTRTRQEVLKEIQHQSKRGNLSVQKGQDSWSTSLRSAVVVDSDEDGCGAVQKQCEQSNNLRDCCAVVVVNRAKKKNLHRTLPWWRRKRKDKKKGIHP